MSDGVAGGDASPARSYRRRPGVIETDLGDELILLDPATQEMFSLNAVGRCIWRGLDEAPLATVVECVLARFEVERAAAEADARALLERLLAAGLVLASG